MEKTNPEMDTLLVSPIALIAYMDDMRHSIRTLAEAVRVELSRHSAPGEKPQGCSPATIGRLRAGTTRLCPRDRARAIETVLHAPPGSLFRLKVQPDQWYRDMAVA